MLLTTMLICLLAKNNETFSLQNPEDRTDAVQFANPKVLTPKVSASTAKLIVLCDHDISPMTRLNVIGQHELALWRTE